MARGIRLLAVLLLSLFSAGFASAREIREVGQIPEISQVANWPAPLLWTPPAARPPAGLHSEAVNTASAPLPFVAITPCRVADSRGNGFTGAYGPPSLAADTTRNFTITGQCGIPGSAVAVSFNFGALNVGSGGDLRVFPAGGAVPLVSTLNYNANTPNIANAAVTPLGTGGAITVLPDATTIDLIIDVNGYYTPEAPVVTIGTIFNYTGNATVNSALAISGSTNAAAPNETRAAGPIPVACAVDTFSVFMDTAPTVLTIFTLQKNANDGNGFLNTSATCSIGVGGTACQAASPSVTFAAGDLAMTSVTGAAGAGGRASISFRCH
jgi:hypothetical protein